MTKTSILAMPPFLFCSFSNLVISAQTRSTSFNKPKSSARTNRNRPPGHTRTQSDNIFLAASVFLPTMYTRSPLPLSACVAARARMVYSPMPDVPPTKTATRACFSTRAALRDRTTSNLTMFEIYSSLKGGIWLVLGGGRDPARKCAVIGSRFNGNGNAEGRSGGSELLCYMGAKGDEGGSDFSPEFPYNHTEPHAPSS